MGHEFTKSNTRAYTGRLGQTLRQCRECNRVRQARWKRKKESNGYISVSIGTKPVPADRS